MLFGQRIKTSHCLNDASNREQYREKQKLTHVSKILNSENAEVVFSGWFVLLCKSRLNLDKDKMPEKRLFPRHNAPAKLAIRPYCCHFRAHSCGKIARFQVHSSFVRQKIFLRRRHTAVCRGFSPSIRGILSSKTVFSLSGFSLNCL